MGPNGATATCFATQPAVFSEQLRLGNDQLLLGSEHWTYLSVDTQDMCLAERQDVCLVETQDMCCVES